MEAMQRDRHPIQPDRHTLAQERRAGKPSWRRPADRGGFTLIEVIVVMVIVALSTAVLFQSFAQTLELRGRLALFLAGAERATLVSSWVRGSLISLMPDYPDGEAVFDGDARRLSGQTLQSLGADHGTPEAFTLSFRRDPDADRTQLVFADSRGEELVLHGWEGSEGAFAYWQAEEERFVSQWPPPFGTRPFQLPAAILVTLGLNGEPWPILATMRRTEQLPPRPRDHPMLREPS